MVPNPHGMPGSPDHPPNVLAPSAQPQQLPPGYGCLVADFNRGPRLPLSNYTSRLTVSGHDAPTRMSEGRWYIPVVAGSHRVRVADNMGLSIITTDLTVQAGGTHYLHVRFGWWRNQVRDGAGIDVTRFGLWGTFTWLLLGLAVGLPLCCAIAVVGTFLTQ